MERSTSDKESQERDRLALGWAFWGYYVLFAAKLAAFAFTGILVLLAEALNNLTDLALTGILCFSWHFSQKPADAEHPFGHRRAQRGGRARCAHRAIGRWLPSRGLALDLR